MYDQVQVDGFVAELQVYAGRLRELRLHLIEEPSQYSRAIIVNPLH